MPIHDVVHDDDEIEEMDWDDMGYPIVNRVWKRIQSNANANAVKFRRNVTVRFVDEFSPLDDVFMRPCTPPPSMASFTDSQQSYSNSFTALLTPMSLDNSTIDISDSDTEMMVGLPRHVYNENSIDLQLAFDDLPKFIHSVCAESKRLSQEISFAEYALSLSQASESAEAVRVVAKPNSKKERATVAGYVQRLLDEIDNMKDFQSNGLLEPVAREIQLETAQMRICTFFEELDEQLKIGSKLAIRHRRVETVIYADGILKIDPQQPLNKYVTLRGRQNLVVLMMRKIYSLISMKSPVTKRSIYYQLKGLLTRKITQQQVDAALVIVCNILEMPPWHLNVLTTARGLVHGDLTLVLGRTEIQCNAHNGTLIPTDLNDLTEIRSNAKFVLIIEKDTIFQKLLVDNLAEFLSPNFIMITGKGYADITTRRFLNILWRLLNIPMFAIVDADAYGIDIFLTYKFGSTAHSFLADELTLPKLRWLGVLPTEVNESTKTIPLGKKDLTKLRNILKRSYFANGDNAAIKAEVAYLLKKRRACEIEGVFKTDKYFARNYLPSKLCNGDYV